MKLARKTGQHLLIGCGLPEMSPKPAHAARVFSKFFQNTASIASLSRLRLEKRPSAKLMRDPG
jgi:hypothetical protein